MRRNKIAITRARLAVIIVIALVAQAAVSPAYAKLPDITPAALKKAVKSGDALHRNADCRYTVDENFHKTHEKHGMPLKRNLQIHWRREGIREYIDVTQHDGRLILGKPSRFVMAHTGEGRKQWQPNENTGDIFNKPYVHAWPLPIDFGMTLTLFKRDKKLGESLGGCTITTLKQEQWQGHECYFVQAIQPDGAKGDVWIDPAIGWRARHVRYWGPDGLIWHEASGEFKDCGNGTWFPVEGVFKLYGNDPNSGERVVSNERKLKVEQVKVNADLTQEDFDIQFPPGTRVHDHSRAVGYVVARNFALLAGKSLPNTEEFGVGSDPNQTKDRMMLVCFFDMNQRPSRNCITQLAKQAEQLKEKGVMAVAVQASKVNESELNEWVKKNDIPFPVGMVQVDEDETRFAWGVKSLPWLILTDKRHIVTTEGFGIVELDDRLKQISEESRIQE
jgi:hypothetical protein